MTMTKITKDLVKTISKLANINITEKQTEKYAVDLSSVVGYMEEIKNIDVEHIAETSRVSNEENVLRNDEVVPSLPQEEALKNTKKKHEGYFVVDQILAED